MLAHYGVVALPCRVRDPDRKGKVEAGIGHTQIVFDEESGALLWTQEWPAAYRNIHSKFATGPLATPTVDGDRVYILGAAGMLSCLDTVTGDLIWRVDTVAEYGVTVPVFGVSQSPLVEGDHLIALLGGEPDAMVVAFDRATGAEAWRAIETTSEPGYSSPIVITAGGVRQLIVWHAAAVTSLHPATLAVQRGRCPGWRLHLACHRVLIPARSTSLPRR